jgi:hypothetical protein
MADSIGPIQPLVGKAYLEQSLKQLFQTYPSFEQMSNSIGAV